MPLDQIEATKDEAGLDAAIKRIDTTVRTTQDGRFASCKVLQNGAEITLATAYAPQDSNARVAFLQGLKGRIDSKTILGLDANCVPDLDLDLKREHTTTPYDNAGADELEKALHAEMGDEGPMKIRREF